MNSTASARPAEDPFINLAWVQTVVEISVTTDIVLSFVVRLDVSGCSCE